MSSVDFDHVCKVYPGGARAVSDCTLAVRDGELIVLVGPSGCGKSTLLRLLAGLEEVTSGTIRIGGRVVNELTPQERNVAMVFQDYALYPHLTVRGNLEFPLRMRHLAPGERHTKVTRVAALLEIDELLERLPRQLSGGQRQRVAMGRALVREPTVFLLDEPLSNLDARLRAQVRVEIAEIQQRTATTMIYVTHDQVEAMTLGQRVAVLHQGQLQQVGTPRQLYEQPANVFVAGFIGTPSMNLFPARVSMCEEGVSLVVAGQSLRLPEPGGIPSGLADVPLTVGVRPESVRLVSEGSAEVVLQAEVESAECLGHETLVYARTRGVRNAAPIHLIVRVEGMHEMSKGEKLRLAIEPPSLHLFDASGERLRAPNQ
jgi:ABC-type sugar transport system ATPase subunit